MSYQKSKRWFADWRDEQGKRMRKSFPTKAEADKYEQQMLALRTLREQGFGVSLTVPKKPPAPARRPASSRRDRQVSR